MKKKRGLFYFPLAVIITALMVGGCCNVSTMRQLDKAKDQVNKGEYSSVAGLSITCDVSCEGCNQLHLTKGDACYRLAKQGKEPEKQYACAVVELAEGIRQTKQWQVEALNLNRPQTYENLCESLRNWRDLSKGAQADAINQQLMSTAQGFLAAEPGNPCGTYFLNNARYATKLPCLLDPGKCPSLCAELQAMLLNISEAVPRAEGSHCELNIQEIKKEVSTAKEIAGCK